MVVFFVFPSQIAGFFSESPEFVSNTATWIWILAFATFPMSSVQVFTQGIANTGATMAPMVITLSTMWVLEVPIAILLAHQTSLGAQGVPWGVVIGNSARSIAFFVYFARGTWLKPGVM